MLRTSSLWNGEFRNSIDMGGINNSAPHTGCMLYDSAITAFSKGTVSLTMQESATRGFNTTTEQEGVAGNVGGSANSKAVESRADASAASPGTKEQQGADQSPQGTLGKVFSKGVRGAVSFLSSLRSFSLRF
jgi:hypothetical protein